MGKIIYISVIAMNALLVMYDQSFWWNAVAAGFILGLLVVEIVDDMA